jgi:hypothetical protein
MGKTGSKLTDLTDAQLVEMAVGKDSQAAYFTLYARYHAGIFAHISRYISEREDIEDICIESFEKAFKQLDTYKPENKFSTWMITIARNTALDHKDKAKTRGKNVTTTSLEQSNNVANDVPDDCHNPIDNIIENQIHENFVNSIEGLPDLYRDIAKMCFIDNIGYKEIAHKTGLPINSIKTRIRRAKEMITRSIIDMEE